MYGVVGKVSVLGLLTGELVRSVSLPRFIVRVKEYAVTCARRVDHVFRNTNSGRLSRLAGIRLSKLAELVKNGV